MQVTSQNANTFTRRPNYDPSSFHPSDPPGAREHVNLFGLYQRFDGASADFVYQTPERWVTGSLIEQVTGCRSLPQWWHVNLYALELERFDTTQPLSNVPVSEIREQKNQFPSPYRSKLKARIIWELQGLPRQVDIDIGTGARVDIVGSGVQVQYLVPLFRTPSGDFSTSFIEYSDENFVDRTLPHAGLTLNTTLAGSVHPASGPRGSCCEPTLTVRRVIPNAAITAGDFVIPIPSAAKRININADDSTAAAIPWKWAYILNGDSTLPTPVPDAGEVRDAAGQFSVDHLEIPQDVSGIYLDTQGAPGAVLGWNITFELEL